MSRPDGGSAFPVIESEYDRSEHQYTGNVYSTGGMTLRDYFAAKAMQGLASSNDGRWFNKDDIHEIAYRAYLLADAMLAQGEKP